MLHGSQIQMADAREQICTISTLAEPDCLSLGGDWVWSGLGWALFPFIDL